MIQGMVMLASYGSFGGGAFGELFAQWEAAGIFDYALPFLLIFALIFGLLTKINVFSDKDKNPMKGINAIIALAVALMALQFNLVSVFFAEIFPRVGIGISLILVLLILGGLFIPTNKESNWFMVTLVVIVFGIIIWIVYSSFVASGYSIGGGNWFGSFLRQYAGIIIFVVLVIAIVATTTSKKNPNRPTIDNMFSKLLSE